MKYQKTYDLIDTLFSENTDRLEGISRLRNAFGEEFGPVLSFRTVRYPFSDNKKLCATFSDTEVTLSLCWDSAWDEEEGKSGRYFSMHYDKVGDKLEFNESLSFRCSNMSKWNKLIETEIELRRRERCD